MCSCVLQSHFIWLCRDIPIQGCAILRGGRKDRDVPIVLIRDGALLKAPSLPKMPPSFDFVKSALHQIKTLLTQSYLERMMCVCKHSPQLSAISPANSYLR